MHLAPSHFRIPLFTLPVVLNFILFAAQTATMPPADALKAISVPEGFKVSLIASEPEVVQPIGFEIDTRGRLWVAECLSYQNKKERDHDRIVILEDTKGDGHFDSSKVFMDNLNCLSGIALGCGGVWIAAAPKLIFIPLKDGEDTPSGPPVVKLDGWSTEAHTIFNTLTWGPDGWLYGGEGLLSKSKVGKPGTPDSERIPFNAGIWRYHPKFEIFEVVGYGTTNPWGIDFDDYGQMFFINTVIGHLWHGIQGAHFKRMFGEDFNPYLYDLIEQTADHYHWAGGAWTDSRGGKGKHSDAGGGHAHAGAMIYLGDNWPDQYRNLFFTCNLHGNRINSDVLERQGSAYVGKHGKDFMLSTEEYFRGLHLKYGPDGGVFVTDWNNGGECHSGSDVTTGRIYKIAYGDVKPIKIDLTKLSDVELVQLHLHKNEWYVRNARQVLQTRGMAGKLQPEAVAALLKIYNENPEIPRKLRALWTLYATQTLPETLLLNQLNSDNEHMRAWAVKLLADQQNAPAAAIQKFAAMAKDDPSSFVRLHIASALQRMPLDQRWDIAQALVSHREDQDDHSLPLMNWYGIEPLVPTNLERAMALARACKIPLIRQFIARRATSAASEHPEVLAVLVKSLSASDDVRFQLDILRGMGQAMKGWHGVQAPEAWTEFSAKLSNGPNPNKEARALCQLLSSLFGDVNALDSIKKTVLDKTQTADARGEALDLFLSFKASGTYALLESLLLEADMRGAALRGLAAVEDTHVPKAILKVYSGLNQAEKNDALNTLASRKEYIPALMNALKDGTIPQNDLSAFTVRTLQSLNMQEVDEYLKEKWGASRQLSSDHVKEIAQYKALVGNANAKDVDAGRGHAVFKKTCAQCHTLFNEGGKIGPDLTGSGRANLDYLLENVIDPNAIIPQEYKAWLVKMKDGRVIVGLVRNETEKSLDVITIGQILTLSKDDIQTKKQSDQSMMPEGLLKALSNAEVLDLISYLQSPVQVPVK